MHKSSDWRSWAPTRKSKTDGGEDVEFEIAPALEEKPCVPEASDLLQKEQKDQQAALFLAETETETVSVKEQSEQALSQGSVVDADDLDVSAIEAEVEVAEEPVEESPMDADTDDSVGNQVGSARPFVMRADPFSSLVTERPNVRARSASLFCHLLLLLGFWFLDR